MNSVEKRSHKENSVLAQTVRDCRSKGSNDHVGTCKETVAFDSRHSEVMRIGSVSGEVRRRARRTDRRTMMWTCSGAGCVSALDTNTTQAPQLASFGNGREPSETQRR